MHCSRRASYRNEKVQHTDPLLGDVSVVSKGFVGLVLDEPIGNAVSATSTGTHVENSPLCPFLRLPPVEILSSIIAAGSEQDKQNFPILLSHISARLRAVALGTPSLWNTIEYTGGRKSYDEIAAKLQRSSGYPLDITVTKLGTIEQARQMLDLLLPHIGRWRSFSFEEWDQDTAEFVLNSLTEAAPKLETLQLAGYTPSAVNPFNGQTPHLRQLSVRGFPLVWDSPLFDTVEDVCLSSGSFHDPSLLASWSNLRSLAIRADPLQPLAFNYEDLSPIVLSSLHTLELNGITEEDIVRILAFADMPQLERMLFTHIKDSHNPAPHILFPLPNMRELRLHATEMCQENLLRVLRQVRFLRKISFEDSSPIPTFIDALTPDLEQEETWLCPNVEDFRVIAFEKDNAHRVYDDTDIANALVHMMKIRSKGDRTKCNTDIRMCVFEGERNEITRHATKWGEERSYQSVRRLAF